MSDESALQDDPPAPGPDIPAVDRVEVLPGTGGPDDGGDIEVPVDDVRMPRDRGPH